MKLITLIKSDALAIGLVLLAKASQPDCKQYGSILLIGKSNEPLNHVPWLPLLMVTTLLPGSTLALLWCGIALLSIVHCNMDKCVES